MITWQIEFGGKLIQLDQVEASVIRERIDPIKDQLGVVLSSLEVETDELKIVFVIDEEGHVSISMRGSSFMVNLARVSTGTGTGPLFGFQKGPLVGRGAEPGPSPPPAPLHRAGSRSSPNEGSLLEAEKGSRSGAG